MRSIRSRRDESFVRQRGGRGDRAARGRRRPHVNRQPDRLLGSAVHAVLQVRRNVLMVTGLHCHLPTVGEFEHGFSAQHNHPFPWSSSNHWPAGLACERDTIRSIFTPADSSNVVKCSAVGAGGRSEKMFFDSVIGSHGGRSDCRGLNFPLFIPQFLDFSKEVSYVSTGIRPVIDPNSPQP